MMGQDDTIEHRARRATKQPGETRTKAIQDDRAEDWPLLSALLGGLFLVILFNTFTALIPG